MLPLLLQVAGMILNEIVAAVSFVIVMLVSALQRPLGLYEVTRYVVVTCGYAYTLEPVGLLMPAVGAHE